MRRGIVPRKREKRPLMGCRVGVLQEKAGKGLSCWKLQVHTKDFVFFDLFSQAQRLTKSVKSINS